ncbi:hypothetical protein [Ornithinimicrobium sp. W1665]|uniref:hypothetical protein n=1 Tax=Ornithinimicrobium sp. W1665 TaxID=3416666 RepID=UPI003D6BA88A
MLPGGGPLLLDDLHPHRHLAHEVVALAGQVQGQLQPSLGGVVLLGDVEHLHVEGHLTEPGVRLLTLGLDVGGDGVRHRHRVEGPRLQRRGHGGGDLLGRALDRRLAGREDEGTDEAHGEGRTA